MPRLFAGILLPNSAHADLRGLRICAENAIVRWMPEQNLHATLVFIGTVPDEDVPPVIDALASIRMDAFDLRPAGVGAFPSPRSARVLWAGLEPREPLIELQMRIQDAFQSLEFSGGAGPGDYHSHVTLARCRGRSRFDARSWVGDHAGFRGRPFRVESFELVRSRTKPEGAEYTVIGRFGDDLPARPG